MARTPMVNHWWNVPLYVSARGLTTSLIPPVTDADDDRGFEIELDLRDHLLEIRTTDGSSRSMHLEARPIAESYAEIMGRLDDLGLHTPIWTMPVEIVGAIPFDRDRQHVAYDPSGSRRSGPRSCRWSGCSPCSAAASSASAAPCTCSGAASTWR